jgi:hypothetical protein
MVLGFLVVLWFLSPPLCNIGMTGCIQACLPTQLLY